MYPSDYPISLTPIAAVKIKHANHYTIGPQIEEDFVTKLESLKDIWEDILPGFHESFTANRSEVNV